MEEYHQKTINLYITKTGQEIIDAMKSMANEREYGLTYISHVKRGENRPMKVGFSSKSPYKHVSILTGDNLDKAELYYETSYEKIAVGSDEWGGEVYAVGYNQKTVENAVNKIAEDLEKRLR